MPNYFKFLAPCLRQLMPMYLIRKNPLSLLRDLAWPLGFNPEPKGMPCYILGRRLLSALWLHFVSPYLPEYLTYYSYSLPYFTPDAFLEFLRLAIVITYVHATLLTHHPSVALASQMQLWVSTPTPCL